MPNMTLLSYHEIHRGMARYHVQIHKCRTKANILIIKIH